VKVLELRRHARRDPDADRLSPQGRTQAENVGRTFAGRYAVVFVSPAKRAAETVARFARGLQAELPYPAIVPGLAGQGTDGTPVALGAVVAELLRQVPEGSRGLAVGHTPLLENAVLGLTGHRVEPLSECEGVALTQEGDQIRIQELRLPEG
jgi:phosphohistidine phosphatase SixA